jgi:hypothetical protein
MPAHAGAFVLRDALLKLGGTTFTNQVWVVNLVPDTPIQQQRTLVPDGTISDVDSATWVMSITGLQDYETSGLADYLADNAGDQVAFVYAPKVGSGKAQWTGTVIVVHPPIGGEQGSFAQMELELPIVGEPVKGAQA